MLQNAAFIDSSDKTPAGGLLTTGTDLARFAVSLYAGKLIKPETLNAMWTEQRTSGGKATRYGLGWGVFLYHGTKAAAHSGDQQGAAATLLLIPEKQFAVAILANSENCDLVPLAHAIADFEL